jgi:uncharacterized protein
MTRTDRSVSTRARRAALVVTVVASVLLGSLSVATASGAAAQAEPVTSPSARSGLVGAAKVLTRNPLYRMNKMRSVGCAPASQVPLDSSANLLAYYRSVLPCLDEAWKGRWKPLARAGKKFRAPKVAVHDGTTSTRCGNPGALSFYCPTNRTIYMYDGEIVQPWGTYDNDYSRGLIRLGATHTLAHEYGHHVQELAGILEGVGYRYGGKPGRQVELQASCLGNVWLSAQSDAYPILLDYAERGEDWRYIAVSNHGSLDNQKRWTDAGFATARPESCNTFTAPRSHVS